MGVNKTHTPTDLIRRNNMEATMTISDVAKVLQLATSTIYKYAEDGKIKTFSTGRHSILPGVLKESNGH
jgi:excisionase family DNA binding protein